MTDQPSDAFFEGFDAYYAGDACPYGSGTTERYDWQLGFNYASGSPDPNSDEARSLGLHNIGDDDE